MNDYKKYLKFVKGPHNPEIEDKIKELIDYFFDYAKRNKMSSESEEDKSIVKDTLTEIFNLELELYGISPDEVELVFDSEEDHSGNFSFNRVYDEKQKKYVDKKAQISINLEVPFEYMDFGTRSRLYSCKGLLNTLLHEIEHLIQYKRYIMNVSSPDNLMFAKEFLYSDVLDGDIRKLYDDNHDSFSIESDAKGKSSSVLCDFLDFNRISSIQNVSIRNVDYHLSSLIVINDGIRFKYDKTDYINYKTDSIIENNLELLDKFPIFKKEYNSDGKKKTIRELIESMYRELSKITSLDLTDDDKTYLISDMCNMYYELIYRRLLIKDSKEIESAINSVGKDNFKIILDSISEYYRQKRILLSGLSKRKYDIKSSLSSDSDYMSLSNNYFIEVTNPQGTRLVNRSDYASNYLNIMDVNENLRKAIISRLPRLGYFILHNGTKIDINTFINEYLIPNLNDKMNTKELISIYKTYVKSSIAADHYVEQEQINADYQSRRSNIDNIIEEFILDSEIKL